MFLIQRFGRQPLSSCLFCILIVLVGCDQPRSTRRRTTAAQQASATAGMTQNDLLKAVDRLSRLDEFEVTQAQLQAKYELNRWISEQDPQASWEPDAIVARAPREIRESDLLNDLGSSAFSDADVQYIQDAILLRNISRSVAQSPPDQRLAQWLAEQGDRLSELEREQLGIAGRLFDWTVRNMQLEATLPYPEEAVAPTVGGEPSATKRIPPPQQAIAGPGYRFPPGEALQYGYGDSLQRARVFILLARQQGIDVVQLAFPGQTVPPRPRPWLTAVLLGKELYLFDCQLGLPISGPGGQGIATLSQVMQDPGLLDALDISEHDYPVAAADLQELIALLDAAPEALSRRMKLAEMNLAGEQRITLTASPSELAERVKQCAGIASASLWTLPYETIWFQAAMKQVLEQNIDAARSYYASVGIFKAHNSLVQGRYLHLSGVLEEHDGRPGAKQYYMECRIPSFALDEVETSKEVQKQMGLVREPQEGDFVWQARLAAARVFALQSKQYATYWLGLCHLATGNYEAAIVWLKDRTLGAAPDGLFTDGARYNLARAYEATGQWELAREQLLADDSPQQHGNLLRARLLKQWADEASAP